MLEGIKIQKEKDYLLEMQMTSKAYLDWLSPENDIYDEVFKNEIEEG